MLLSGRTSLGGRAASKHRRSPEAPPISHCQPSKGKRAGRRGWLPTALQVLQVGWGVRRPRTLGHGCAPRSLPHGDTPTMPSILLDINATFGDDRSLPEPRLVRIHRTADVPSASLWQFEFPLFVRLPRFPPLPFFLKVAHSTGFTFGRRQSSERAWNARDTALTHKRNSQKLSRAHNGQVVVLHTRNPPANYDRGLERAVEEA
jgi:hypothetical protein